MERKSSRRSFLKGTVGVLSGATVVGNAAFSEFVSAQVAEKQRVKNASETRLDASSIRFALNFGTIRDYNLTLREEFEIARAAGYRSVEIWIDRLADYSRDGKTEFAPRKLAELRKYLDGEGLRVEGGIGFATWIMNEPERRAAGLDELKRQAEALAAIGCACVAAPAAGPWNEKIEGIETIAERYRAVLEVCEPFGVRPLLELWGASPTLSKLSDGLAICAETERADAGLLLDAYHLYRGGNSFSGLNLVAGSCMPIFHLNDYPATPPREETKDSDRVFPGDGIAPLRAILATLLKNGFNGALSLELFNPVYRKQMSALDQAKTGLAKMKALFDDGI